MKVEDIVEIVGEITQDFMPCIETYTKTVMMRVNEYCKSNLLDEEMTHMIMCYASQIAVNDIDFSFAIDLVGENNSLHRKEIDEK